MSRGSVVNRRVLDLDESSVAVLVMDETQVSLRASRGVEIIEIAAASLAKEFSADGILLGAEAVNADAA